MPLFVLHQNMRDYGGVNAARSQAFAGTPPMAGPYPGTWPPVPPLPPNGFLPVGVGLAPAGNAVCVAGLTEVTNSAAASGAVGPMFTAVLGGAPITYAVIKAFRSAISTRQGEYVAIAVGGGGAGVTPLAIGRIMFGRYAALRDETMFTAAAPPPLVYRPRWQERLPDGAGADYQGIVYAKVRIPGPPAGDIAVGFAHNTYTLNTREAFMQKIPSAVLAMRDGVAVDHVYLGGDFNVTPQRSYGRGPSEVWQYSAGTAGPLIFGGVAGGTTRAGNLIDFWFADIEPGVATPVAGGVNNPVPTAYGNTMDYNSTTGQGWMSDHAAIVLRIV